MRKIATGMLAAALPLVLFARPQSESRVENRVIEVLRQTGDFLRSLDGYRVIIDESFEVDQDEDGVLLEYDGVQELVFAPERGSRPHGFHASVDGDLVKRSFWYDGQTFAMLDRTHNVYASGPAPAGISELLDTLRSDYGFVGPLVELLFRDLAQLVRQHARSGSYVGIHSAAGRPSHHIYVSGRQVDWQLWVDAGEQPLPRKLSVTFRQDEGRPRYSAVFRSWDLAPEIASGTFRFEPPEGARKLDLSVPPGGHR